MHEHDISTCTVNHGVIIEPPKETDYLAGVLPYVIEVPDGKWQPYQRNYELQYAPNLNWVDYFNCVTQSILNSVVMSITEKIENKKIPLGHLNYLKRKSYIDENGNLNFSEKFSSILNNTIPDRGNTYGQALDHLRDDGLIPESMLPSHVNQEIKDYYNRDAITAKMIALGQEFKKYFDIRHEYVGANPEFPTVLELQKALKQSPLIGIIPGHSLCDVQQMNYSWIWFNSYIPFNEEHPGSPTWAKKIVVNFVGNPDETIDNPVKPYIFTRTINPSKRIPGERGEAVLQLQTRLGINQTSIYDDTTRAAVFRYQLNHVLPINPGWLWEIISLLGKSAGPKTVRQLNLEV